MISPTTLAALAVVALVGYLIGSISSGYLVGRIASGPAGRPSVTEALIAPPTQAPVVDVVLASVLER